MKEQVLNVLPFLASGVPYFIVSTLSKYLTLYLLYCLYYSRFLLLWDLQKKTRKLLLLPVSLDITHSWLPASVRFQSGFMDFSALNIAATLGVETVSMGALGGIISGLVTTYGCTISIIRFLSRQRLHSMAANVCCIVVIMTMAVIGLLIPLSGNQFQSVSMHWVI